MFNSLRSGNGAMAIMAATIAVMIATTTPASAWGFDWFAPVSNWLFGTPEETALTGYSSGTTSGSYLEDATTLVEQRYTLRNENYETKIFLADIVKEFRSNGANEEDVSQFLDELDYEFEARLYEKNNGVILTSATAGYVLCTGPQFFLCAAAVSVVVLAQGLWMLSPQGQNAITATKSWISSHMSSSDGIEVTEVDRTDFITIWPSRPRSGCSCECKIPEVPGTGNFAIAFASGGGRGLAGCKPVYAKACSYAKEFLARGSIHHQGGKCLDSKGKKFLGKGNTLIPHN